MASYLATVAIGHVPSRRSTTHASGSGLSPRSTRRRWRRAVGARPSPEIIELGGDNFGPYPFSSTGVIVGPADDAEYALETQTRPSPRGVDELPTLVHETAPPVVRRLGDAEVLAGHLAQRGFRDLRGVAVGRRTRRRKRPDPVFQSSLTTMRPTGPSRPRKPQVPEGDLPPGLPAAARWSSSGSAHTVGDQAFFALLGLDRDHRDGTASTGTSPGTPKRRPGHGPDRPLERLALRQKPSTVGRDGGLDSRHRWRPNR